MRLDIPGKLRQALGLAKDHASIGKAFIQNYDDKGFIDIEIAVVRATSHDNSPIDDRTMHEILFLVSDTPGSVPFLAERISQRLGKTRDCFVALKTLLLIHRLLRGGSRCFEQQLRVAYASGHLQMGCSWFLRNPDPSFVFLQYYAAYLEERVGWIINQAGKLEPIMFGGMKFRRYKEKSMDLVFHILPKCQEFIDKVLSCSPFNTWPSDNLVQAAFCNALKESFQVYMTYSDGIAELVNMFFDLSRSARALACGLLKKASQQSQDLHDLYDKCRGWIRNKSLEYPSVRAITMDHIMALEQCTSYTPAGSVLIKSSGATPSSMSASPKGVVTFKGGKQGRNSNSFSSTSPFSFPMETKISEVWVVFEDEDQKESHEPVEKHLNVDYYSQLKLKGSVKEKGRENSTACGFSDLLTP